MFFGALVLVVAVSMILLFLFFVVSLWVENNWNSVSSYECGFDAKSVVRMSFSYRFFLIAVLFLIFDVEISLLLPIPFLFSSVVGYCVFSVFVGLLMVGLVYEVFLGSMEWL